MQTFKCRGCGETDSIVEVSLIPSIQNVTPDPAPNHAPYEDVDYGDYENFYESLTVLGFACSTDTCPFWQGSYGHPARFENTGSKRPIFEWARKLQDIAEEVPA